MRDQHDANYSLVLAFDSDEPEFCRGFEAGRLWEQLKHDEDKIHQTIHATNAEMAMRMCESTGRSFTAEDLGNECHVDLLVAGVDEKSEI